MSEMDRESNVKAPFNNGMQFAQVFRESEMYDELSEIVSNPNERLLPEGVRLKDNLNSPEFVVGFGKQFRVCLSQSMKIAFRNKIALMARFFKVILIAILLGTLFVNLGYDQNNIRHRANIMYYFILEIMFANLITIRDLHDPRPIFYEQIHLRRYYKTFPYFISYIIPELIIGFLEVLIYVGIIYWLIDLNNTADRFFHFLLNLYSVELLGSSILTILSSLTASSTSASALVLSFDLLLTLSSGFILPPNDIPGWWIWLYWASPLKWVYEGALLNELHGEQFTCADAGSGCYYLTGQAFTDAQGFNSHKWFRWIDLAVAFGFAFLFLALSYFALLLKDQRPRVGSGLPLTRRYTKKELLVQRRKTRRVAERGEPEGVVVVSMSHHENPLLRVYGAYFSFKEINYYVPLVEKKDDKIKKEEKDRDISGGTNKKKGNELQLLHEVTGYAKPGTLLALMGAGKSTLLDVLAGRKNVGRITGDVLLNGATPNDTFTRTTAYVTQTDIIFPTHTVKEAITFSAMCRLPEQVSKEEKKEFVEKIIHELQLTPIQDRVVAGGTGLSVEQRKRLNLAIELAANPQLIFLDEPTSGLDSTAAKVVMSVVKKLVQQGRTIICTIHQPSSDIFSLFDSLLLLAEGGRTIYFGDIGEKGEKVLEYAQTLGYRNHEGHNLADFVLEFSAAQQWNPTPADVNPQGVTCDKHDQTTENNNNNNNMNNNVSSNQEVDRVDTIDELIENYNRSEGCRQSQVLVAQGPQWLPADFKPPKLTGRYATSFMAQLRLNLNRSFLSFYSRRKSDVIGLAARMFFFGVFMGTLFINRMGTDQSGINNRVSWIFFSVIFGGFTGFAYISSIVQERSVFYHEQAAGTYRPSTYGLSIVSTLMPIGLLASIIYIVPAYWICHFDPSNSFPRFLFFLLVDILITTVIIFLASLLAVATPSEGFAVMLLGLIMPMFLLFAGFFVSRQDIPGWWIYMYWISFIHYAVEPLILEIFNSLTLYCTPEQIDLLGNCPVTDGHQIAVIFDLVPAMKWVDVGILAALIFIMAAAICLSLAKLRFQKT